MSLDYVILGMLSIAAKTGYDLKKEIAGSRFLHWSGNSNQIYKTLLSLSEAGLVESEVVHQSKGPTKKLFNLTRLGRERLRAWMMSEAEFPEFRNPFLTRLLFAGVLDDRELESVILAYEEQLRLHLRVAEEQSLRREENPDPRAHYIARRIDDYAVTQIETELAWLRKLRNHLPPG